MLQNTDQNIEENTLISEALTHANLINSPQLNFDKKKVNCQPNFQNLPTKKFDWCSSK
jgi:hypothetical protein